MTARRALAAAIVLVIGAAGLMFLGLEPLFSLSAGALAGVFVLLLALRHAPVRVDDGPRRERASFERGSEVARLAWGFNMRTGVAGIALTRRTRAVLARRLAAAGIDADDPAHVARIDAVMGEGVWQRIDAVRAQRADLERALDTTERLTRPQERS